jgi:DNA/RNA-binding domain of Phe-tRNA-synthetase-like protein
VEILVDKHPHARVFAFVTAFPKPLGELSPSDSIVGLLRQDAASPLDNPPGLGGAIREMLRHGGYKPSGRGKPASEYLLRVAADGGLSSINLAVDACNAVSLHSGFPISVVDLGRAKPPFRIEIAAAGASYVFNASDQVIALSGLLCLFDADGPCANAVRDSQRTKTHADTRQTMSVVWGAADYEQRVLQATAEYRRILETAGAQTEPVDMIAAERDPQFRAELAPEPQTRTSPSGP